MSAIGEAIAAPPEAIVTLVDRFDPDVIDVPDGRARIRLSQPDGGAWDAQIREDRIRLVPATNAEPDALLEADSATWRRVAGNLRGGMDAFRKGRLKVRRSVHLGTGFLAATSGATEPGRLEFRSIGTSVGRISILEAGGRGPGLCI